MPELRIYCSPSVRPGPSALRCLKLLDWNGQARPRNWGYNGALPNMRSWSASSTVLHKLVLPTAPTSDYAPEERVLSVIAKPPRSIAVLQRPARILYPSQPKGQREGGGGGRGGA